MTVFIGDKSSKGEDKGWSIMNTKKTTIHVKFVVEISILVKKDVDKGTHFPSLSEIITSS